MKRRTPTREQLLKERKLLEYDMIRMERDLLQAMGNVVTERPTDGGWSSVLLDPGRKGLVITDQLTMIMQARRMFHYDFNARAAIWALVKYIIGRGVAIKPKSKDARVRYIWREFWSSDRNKMGQRQFEIPARLFRDGEVMLQFFRKDAEDRNTWKTTVRFIDPLTVKNPPDKANNLDPNISSGIECDENDVETPVKYWVHNPWNEGDVTAVPASEILHIKIFADADQRRGSSHILPVMRLITQYQQWLENRIVLNKIRSAVVLVRKISGSASDVNRIAQTLGQASVLRNNETKSNNIRPGTILNANEGVDYKFEAPNINAQDVKDDGRAMITRIAGATGLPEYLFGDASNANYASTMIAESPFVKEIEHWQSYLEEAWLKPMFKRIIQAGVDAGVIQAPVEDDITKIKSGEIDATEDEDNDLMEESDAEVFYGCDVEWPQIVHREFKEQVEALTMARAQGWISDATCSENLGYSPAEEFRKQFDVRKKMDEQGDPWSGSATASAEDDEETAGKNQIDDELQSIMKGMSPEEKQAVMNAKTPEEVMALVGKNGREKISRQKNGGSDHGTD